MKVVKDSHGRPILIEELNKIYDLWVHTGRDVDIKKTYPDGPVARQKLKSPGNEIQNGCLCDTSEIFMEKAEVAPIDGSLTPRVTLWRCVALRHVSVLSLSKENYVICTVYEISRHVRGKAILISNTGYQAVRLLKSVYEQLQFRIIVHVNKTAEEIFEILQNECRKPDAKSANALVCVLYGTPDNFEVCKLPQVFSMENCPDLTGKPKLLYIIGNDTVVQQVDSIQARNLGPDYFVGATGFFGIMFFIYVQHLFAHELDAASMWELEEQFSILHNYSVRSYSTLTKEFYFFPGLTTSV